MRAGLSKSKIAAFEQCPKRLWLQKHRPDLVEFDDGAKARFAAGHLVGAAACDLVPGGVMVDAEPDLASAERRTRELLADPAVPAIFEATLSHDGVLVRIDILERDGDRSWRLAEVKSTTKQKPAHTGDVATQVWVAAASGLELTSATIRHLDNGFVLEREGDYAGAFAETDLLEAAKSVVATRPETVAAARATLEGPEPARTTGPHCLDPYECEFLAYCRGKEPPEPEWPVSVLPGGGGKRWLEAGISDLFQVDPDLLTSAIHARVHAATVTGEPFHDRTEAARLMAGWDYPRTWLDFETIAFALPRWVGTRPYEPVPFQFSAHVERREGEYEHVEFLSLDGHDPRRKCAEALVEGIPDSGAIIAYYASFERARLMDLANAFPDLAEPLQAMADRLVDLLPVTRATWYHRDQRGSWSIKAVLPTVAPELGYAGLEVKDGGDAQAAYVEAISEGADEKRIAAIAAALRTYCGRDTEAMITLARHLVTGVSQGG